MKEIDKDSFKLTKNADEISKEQQISLGVTRAINGGENAVFARLSNTKIAKEILI
jgi:hypothetical protein